MVVVMMMMMMMMTAVLILRLESTERFHLLSKTLSTCNYRQQNGRHREIWLFIHAEHVVHRRGYCFHFGCMFVCLYVCMYVTALERKRLIGMT